MRKIIIFILTIACFTSLIGCTSLSLENKNNNEQYSFSWSDERFIISNGNIIFGEEDKLDGGNLEIIQQDLFTDVIFYKTRFYLMDDDRKIILLSNSVESKTGDALQIGNDLGEIVSEDLFYKINGKDIKGNLWFELITRHLSGEENAYQLQLDVIEIIE